jgi:hypothetical protein
MSKEPENCIIFEDVPKGVESASNAGMKCIVINTHHEKEEFKNFNNILGLVPFFPGGANVTGNIAITLVLALFTFFITSFNGNKNYWGHIFMPPGVPKGLWILLVPIEIIGMLNKPIV